MLQFGDQKSNFKTGGGSLLHFFYCHLNLNFNLNLKRRMEFPQENSLDPLASRTDRWVFVRKCFV